MKLPDAVTMLVEGIATEVLGCPVTIGGLMVGAGRGVGKYKGRGRSYTDGCWGFFFMGRWLDLPYILGDLFPATLNVLLQGAWVFGSS